MADGKEKYNEIYREIADEIGEQAAIKLYNHFKGQQVTFPMRLHDRRSVHEQIQEEYDGTNIKYLANKYNYSEKTVRYIVKKTHL